MISSNMSFKKVLIFIGSAVIYAAVKIDVNLTLGPYLAVNSAMTWLYKESFRINRLRPEILRDPW
jgi:hypothetical protein